MRGNEYDAVVLFPFGMSNAAAETNVVLLRRAVEEAESRKVPLIMHEIFMSDTVPSREYMRLVRNRIMVVGFGGKTICAYAQKVKEDMAREIWKNVIVIAATPIIDRCMADLHRVYPGSVTLHDSRQLFKDAPYGLWFWSKTIRFWRFRAAARWLFEHFLSFVPWPVYRWFALRK